MSLRLPAVGLLVVLSVACGDGGMEPEIPGAVPTIITVLSGSALGDTVGVRITEPVVGLVTTGGRALAGVVVTLSVQQTSARVSLRAAVDGPSSGSGMTTTTDAQGEFQFFVETSTVAGQSAITMRPSGTFATAEEVFVQILPGQAAEVRLLAIPDVAQVGDTLTMSGEVVDRHGNRLDDPIAFSVDGPAVLNGDELTGTDWGRVSIVGTAGALVDSASAVMVPAGRIVFSDQGGLKVSGIDGSNFVQVGVGLVDATVNPLGDAAAFGVGGAIFVTDLITSSQITGSTPFRAASLPRYAPDGSVIYFVAAFSDQGAEVWRTSPDGGTILERVTEVPVLGNADRHPSPSNGGDRLVFSRTKAGSIVGPLLVKDLGTGVETAIGVDGQSSRWSPDDTWIAYLTSGVEIRMVRPDGSDDQPVTSGTLFYKNFAWSPDGRFILAASDAREFVLIEVASGETLTIPSSHQPRGVDWYP